MAAEGCAVGRGVRFLRLSPPTSALGRRGRRRGAQLDGEFASYASRRRLGPDQVRHQESAAEGALHFLSTPLAADFGPGPEAAVERCGGMHSWTGSSLSTPFRLAADFGPNLEAAEERGAAGRDSSRRRLLAWPGGGAADVRSAGRGVRFLRLSPPTSGLARRRQLRGTQLDGEFAFYAPRRRLRAQRWRLKGAQLDGKFASYASRRRLRAWLGRARRRVAKLDGEFASYTSPRRFWAQPGGGGGGVRRSTEPRRVWLFVAPQR